MVDFRAVLKSHKKAREHLATLWEKYDYMVKIGDVGRVTQRTKIESAVRLVARKGAQFDD